MDIHKIIGTEGRAADFDLGFHPLEEESRERWVNMAFAYLLGIPLPAVELIRVGDVYFVRDGHHRVSVALALGQKLSMRRSSLGELQPCSPQTRAMLRV
jgi:hypothetical protein